MNDNKPGRSTTPRKQPDKQNSQSAVQGPRPTMYPHIELDCNGQFHWDDADTCYRCIVCGEVRAFYEW